MKDVNDGGCAFPVIVSAVTDLGASETGMTLRDHFAGQAMMAIVGGGLESLNETQIQSEFSAMSTSDYVAMSSYSMADAMIEVRAKMQQTKKTKNE